MIPHDQNTQPQFVWRKVQTELKLAKSQRQARIPLKPNIKIEYMDIQQNGLYTRLNIDIQRSLQFQDSIGWNWHKSSNLPLLSVKLEIRKSSDNTILIPPAAIHANIYAVKIVQKTLQNEQPSYLLDIGINGQNSIQLSQGCGYFNALRFSSTSYNNEGVRFYLLIVVWKQQNGCQPLSNIISSVISPPIFVDSRKSARNYQEKKFMSFVDLFRPNEIQRFFTKRQARQTKVEAESMRTIENNEEGLLHYLTAPNIRHKVKHPLFLAMKFSNAFKIFYNRQSPYFIKNPATLSNVINRIQKKLIKQVGVLRRYKKSENIKKKQFAIVVTSEFQKMSKIRILEMIECLQTNSIQLIQQNTLDQSTFSNIQDLGDIAQVYKQHYVFLIKKTDAQLSSRKSKHCKAQQQEKSLQKAEFPESVIQQKKIIEFSSSQSRAQKRFYDYLGQNNANHDFQAIEALRKKIKLCNAEDFPPKGFQMSNNPFEGYSSFLQMNKHFQRPQKIQNYYKFSFPLRSKGQDPNAKEEGIKIWISEKQVILKIKQMCLQVYQRNKNSILQHLQTLKKSNLKWKVKDVQNFLFYYEGAIMNQIFFRERLLHHMHLENEILKAKLASMQQLALKDLEDIKKNFTSMNKYLPESFIKSKLKENAVFNHDIFLPNNRAQGVNTRLLQGNVIIKATQTMQQHQIKHQNSFDVAQKTPEIPMDGQISSSCNFVPNVFNFGESPLNG